MICQQTGKPCDEALGCGLLNAPLLEFTAALESSAGNDPGVVSEEIANAVYILNQRGEEINVDLDTQIDVKGRPFVCAKKIMESDFATNMGPDLAFDSVHALISGVATRRVDRLRSSPTRN